MTKRYSKFIATFDHAEKILLILSTISHSVSIVSLSTVIGAPVKITSSGLSLVFFSTRIPKKLLKTFRKK